MFNELTNEFDNFPVNEVVVAMQRHWPISSSNTTGLGYREIAVKYVDLTVNELLGSGDYIEEPEEDVYHIYKGNIRKQLTNKYNGNDTWYAWLYNNYPLFETRNEGHRDNNRSVPSSVRSYLKMDCMLKYLQRNRLRIASHIEPVTGQSVDVPIDIKGLYNFIDNSLVYNSTETCDTAYKRRIHNMQRACIILSLAELNNGVLRQAVSSSEWPRQYLIGMNLQSGTRSEVREAALGKCYKYDVNSSAFAYKASIILQFGNGYIPHNMLELLRNKQSVRQGLVQRIMRKTKASEEFKTKLIKQAITAMGFGTQINSKYGEVNNIIKHREDYERFVNDPWIVRFSEEQREFTKIIKKQLPASYVKQHMPTALKNGKYNQSKLESWLYADFETQLMTELQNILNKKYGANTVVLWVHDCIYTRVKIDMDYFTQAAENIKFPLVTFSKADVKGTRYNEIKKIAYHVNIDEQRQRISAEERKARNYSSDYADTSTGNKFIHNLPYPSKELSWEEICELQMQDLNKGAY